MSPFSRDQTIRITGDRIVREEISAPLEPESFLRWGAGHVRGFWARGGGWIAHVGEIASLRIEGAEVGGVERFERVRAESAALLGRDPSMELSHSPRMFGGFSFRNDHEAIGVWEGFPSACFILPELELERGADGVRLSAQARLAGDDDADSVRERLRARLDEVVRAVSALPRSSSGDDDSLGAGSMGGQGAALRSETGAPLPAGTPDDFGHLEMQRDAWDGAVLRALEAIESGRVKKVVLARTLDVSLARPLDPIEVFPHLWRENRGAHVFLFEPVPGVLFLGAAPETVATLADGVFRATAVAGSIPAGADEAERSGLARKLLASEKDRVEHAYTVKEMVRCLSPLAGSVTVDSEPHVLSLSRIQHLETEVEARVNEGETVLSLLAALHPTPAVCGLPRDEALEFLREEEPFERGWYAGPVGWFDGRGNGVFVPALRSAVCRASKWRLIAGAGIVPGSDPALEWEETGMKFQPILRALASSGLRRGGPG